MSTYASSQTLGFGSVATCWFALLSRFERSLARVPVVRVRAVVRGISIISTVDVARASFPRSTISGQTGARAYL